MNWSRKKISKIADSSNRLSIQATKRSSCPKYNTVKVYVIIKYVSYIGKAIEDDKELRISN